MAPRVIVVEDPLELARVGADLVCDVIAATPAARVVVATGRTPMGMYAELAERRRSGTFDTRAITAVQLDEYLALEPGDPRSLFAWMRRSFLEPLGIGEDRVRRLPLHRDLAAGCAAFDAALDAGGPLDLAILGIGPNGHLGFNEPPGDPGSGTRVVQLSPATIEANAHYWGDGAPVPPTAVTMGLRHLLSARTILLLASGASKRAIVHRALAGSVGPEVPASYLREAAGDVTVVVDRAAWDPLASTEPVPEGERT